MLAQLDLLHDAASAQVSEQDKAAVAVAQVNPNERLNSKHFVPFHSASASELRLSKIAGSTSCLSMLLDSLSGFRLHDS